MIPRSALADQQRGLLILGELSHQMRFLVEQMLEQNTLALLDLSEVDPLAVKKTAKKVAKPAPKAKKSKKK